MSYFLKKTRNKKGTYLQIYESYYDPERKGGAHRSYKALGYVHELEEQGIPDPVSFYSDEVAKLNEERKAARDAEKRKQISEESPERYTGYFPLKNIHDGLNVKNFIDLFQTVTGFRFSLYDLISALVYSRAVCPCSKSRTFEQVIPKLFDDYSLSLDQIYDGLEFLGAEYEKIIEIYNHQVNEVYPFDTSSTYFDCTNFYFEIDREDDFRRKGPSKENRKEPIVGMGLLLDANQIPIGMKLYPGNQSEKPLIREIVDGLKKRNNITGRTIRVADKGLNCGDNIYHALQEGDGYIFSKSVKQLPATEQEWVLLENGYRDVKDREGNLLYRWKECVDDFAYDITKDNGEKRKVSIPEKRVVTFNPKLAEKQKYEINKQVEKARLLKAVSAKRSEFGDSAKYVIFTPADKTGKETDGKIKITMNDELIEKNLKLAGYNLLVTSERKMSAEKIYSTYHNLWRIEESFRVMKSQLDARPVYLQKKDTITGHFLICYITVLLTRLFQIRILDNQFCSEALFDFFREFKTVKISQKKYINLSRKTALIDYLSSRTSLPLTSYFLSDSDVKKMLSHSF